MYKMQLIKITEREGKQVVSAREVYQFLSIDNGSNFSKWAKINIEEMFSQNIDYQVLRLNDGKQGRPSIDYALTLECAKEVSMMSRCENGKKARLYFIECERKLKEAQKPMSILDLMEYSVKQLREHENRLSTVESDVKYLKSLNDHGYCSIMGYAILLGVSIDIRDAIKLGQITKSECKELGIKIGTTPDQRFGKVNTYPKEILRDVFSRCGYGTIKEVAS